MIKEHAFVHIRVAKILYFIQSIYILMIEKIHTFFMIDTSAAIFLVSIWRVTFFFINFSFRTMISVSTFALKLLSSHIMLLIISKQNENPGHDLCILTGQYMWHINIKHSCTKVYFIQISLNFQCSILRKEYLIFNHIWYLHISWNNVQQIIITGISTINHSDSVFYIIFFSLIAVHDKTW